MCHYHYTKILVVHACMRLEAIPPKLERFLSRHQWTRGDTIDSPLIQLAMAPAAELHELKNAKR